MNPLPETALDRAPFVRRNDSRNNVEGKDALRAGLITIDVEGDPHSKEGLFRSLLITLQLSIIKRGDALEQRARRTAWRTVRAEHLVVETVEFVSVEEHKKAPRAKKPSGRHCPRYFKVTLQVILIVRGN